MVRQAAPPSSLSLPICSVERRWGRGRARRLSLVRGRGGRENAKRGVGVSVCPRSPSTPTRAAHASAVGAALGSDCARARLRRPQRAVRYLWDRGPCHPLAMIPWCVPNLPRHSLLPPREWGEGTSRPRELSLAIVPQQNKFLYHKIACQIPLRSHSRSSPNHRITSKSHPKHLEITFKSHLNHSQITYLH